eukprot:m.10028 g.10028  ORF g.10028 m.10028 type:complete len:171 (-) comp3662_c0_seq1:172-684(-)
MKLTAKALVFAFGVMLAVRHDRGGCWLLVMAVECGSGWRLVVVVRSWLWLVVVAVWWCDVYGARRPKSLRARACSFLFYFNLNHCVSSSFPFPIPFQVLMVSGSFGVKMFFQLRIAKREERVTEATTEQLKALETGRKSFDLSSEYQRLQEQTDTDWSQKRLPRPGEPRE